MNKKVTAREGADPDFRLLSEKVVETMKRLRVPGVAVGVLHSGQ